MKQGTTALQDSFYVRELSSLEIVGWMALVVAHLQEPDEISQ